MKKFISEEIENMKYLLGYKRGVVISEQAAPSSETQPPAGTTPPATTTPATPIKIGVKYPSIVELQNSLNTKSQAGLTPDGKYGPKTSASILAALQKLPASTPTNTTPENAQVKDTDSEAIKKTAETGVQGGNTVVQNDNKGGATGDSQSNNKSVEVDLNSIQKV
jgi:hypothetical protein